MLICVYYNNNYYNLGLWLILYNLKKVYFMIRKITMLCLSLIVLAGCVHRPCGGRGDEVCDSKLQAQMKRFAGNDRVFFKFDSAELNYDAKQTLSRQVEWLRENPKVSITVEGHCDERGTREYNLALGEKRANSSRDYLLASGINNDRITVVSYGKERPVVSGANDAHGHEMNRRSVTVVND